MKFKAKLKSIKLFGYHGVLPEEKENGQVFILDIEFIFEKKDNTDDINNTVDYAEVYKAAEKVFNSKNYDLLETLIYDIGTYILDKFNAIEELKVSAAKPTPPIEGTLDKVIVSTTLNR